MTIPLHSSSLSDALFLILFLHMPLMMWHSYHHKLAFLSLLFQSLGMDGLKLLWCLGEGSAALVSPHSM